MQINWDSFKIYNQDSRGIRYKFEDLCRQLFVNENLSGNRQFKYLHANPNNCGLETEPIYDEINDRWIGFQAKYFDEAVGYDQIKGSAQKIVEYYTGSVNLVFLFSNKPITTTAKGYVDTVKLLKDAGIEMQLITDSAILDLVRNKYPYLASYYFGNLTLRVEWFKAQAGYMYDVLGERYNREFNVETTSLNEMSLFVHDRKAADYLNAKKADLLAEVDTMYYKGSNREYLRVLSETVAGINDVDEESLFSSKDWINIVDKAVNVFLEEYRGVRSELVEKCKKVYSKAENKEITKIERDAAIKEYDELRDRIYEIDILLDLPERIRLSDREIQLLYGDVLLLHGEAGIGKSQLLASETQSLLQENRSALLLIAGIYYTDDPIREQIMKNLSLNYAVEELIDALETIGERDNRIVPVFIDAINETWNRKLWKAGLPLIVEKIKQAPMVRLVVSYRSEYEKNLIPDSIQNGIEQGDIMDMLHSGFMDNSLEAIKEFMDYYGIPFTPLEYFGYEMSNPLFLTLYCQTYDGEEVSLPTLYDRVIKHANESIYRLKEQILRNKGYEEDSDFITPLVTELAEYMSEHDERSILKEEIIHLAYWGAAGLSAEMMVPLLVKEHILHDSCYDDKEHYYFAYDQMNDYFCAKAIMAKYTDKDVIRRHLLEKVLGVMEEGFVDKSWNIDLFINVCALYADRYGEECIDIIEKIKNPDDRWEVFARYIDSLQWRESRHITGERMINLLKEYRCSKETLWSMLIGNSVKIHHPLNADFLHEFLMHYDLKRRDYLWTCYINKLTEYNSDRVVQLIQMYDRGEKLSIKSEKQLKLLLTLFGWLLTSSNRWLRDYTSKAMIEILKENFVLCVYILDKFKGVDDPYVIQRLYGVVFGAYSKCDDTDGQELAEYVYNQIFAKEEVYPDILLRDYARLIIEKFLFDNPDYKGIINHDRIIPPYKSDPIPEIEDQHYLEKEHNGATAWLIHSMTFDGMGIYGDFGRYVFQSALHSFEVDDKKMFNYAVYYIFNELGFSDELFYDHDRHCGSYNRHHTAKTERIGKKYQWITMYNMLARISDNCRMIDRWSNSPEEFTFEGAWEPYVRDFDPTLNKNFMTCDKAPYFDEFDEHVLEGRNENRLSDVSTDGLREAWLGKKGFFLNSLGDHLVLADDSGQEWVCLTKYCDTGREKLDREEFLSWCWHYAYFGTSQQAEELSSCIDKGIPVVTNTVASFHETYAIFNREYPWSPSCRDFEEYAWIDIVIKTGEYMTIAEKVPKSNIERLDAILSCYQGNDEYGEKNGDVSMDLPYIRMGIDDEIVKRKVEVEKEIGRMLHATTELLWEEEYDATKEDAISYSVPCKKLIDIMGLRQLDRDGFFFDRDRKLAAFDTRLTQKVNTVVVRKDILDEFLATTGLILIWITHAGKDIYGSDSNISHWSEWEGVMVYDGSHVNGDVRQLNKINHL